MSVRVSPLDQMQKRDPLHVVILLRGLAREKRHWGEFPKTLEREAERRRLRLKSLCLDLPGAGHHNEVLSPLDIDKFADFIERQLEWVEPKLSHDFTQFQTDLHLVGMSLGGMVALKLAETRPSLFDSVVTINTSAKNLGTPIERVLPRAIKSVIEIVATSDLETRERKILALVANSSEVRANALSSWVAIQRSRPVAVWNLAFQLLAASKYQVPESLEIPHLVLSSREDRMVSPNCSVRLAALHRAPHFIHPSAGHDLGLDAPDWLAEKICDWVSQREIARQNLRSIRE